MTSGSNCGMTLSYHVRFICSQLAWSLLVKTRSSCHGQPGPAARASVMPSDSAMERSGPTSIPACESPSSSTRRPEPWTTMQSANGTCVQDASGCRGPDAGELDGADDAASRSKPVMSTRGATAPAATSVRVLRTTGRRSLCNSTGAASPTARLQASPATTTAGPRRRQAA